MRRLVASAVLVVLSLAVIHGQPAATLTVEQLLKERLGIPAADFNRFTAGEAVIFPVTPSADNEVAAAGVIRAKGDLRRILAWLRDIESFMKASGVENVGAVPDPATPANFANVNLSDVDFTDLKSCKPGACEIRMPASFLGRFQKEVDWSSGNAQAQAADLARALVAQYVAAYQKGGNAALAAFHDPSNATDQTNEFLDLLRRSTKAWDLEYNFASYLENYPKGAPAGVESRYYWTRDKVGRKPALTLHHVILQELPGGRILAADKQFYASRQFDAGLMIAFGVPNTDFTSFDLVVSVKARASAIRGVAGRLLRGRIDGEVRDALKVYLEWIKNSASM